MSEATVDPADLHAPDDRDSEIPLREDIRLLGRVLGEVIEEQAGGDVLALVESTRVEAFRIRRSEVDRGGLAQRLAGLDPRSASPARSTSERRIRKASTRVDSTSSRTSAPACSPITSPRTRPSSRMSSRSGASAASAPSSSAPPWWRRSATSTVASDTR